MSGSDSSAGIAASAVSAYLQTTDFPLPPVVFQYNPGGLRENITAHYTRVNLPSAPGGSRQQFIGTAPSNMTVTIQLDAFAIPPLPPSLTLAQLQLMMTPTPTSVAMNVPKPPTVMFGWGPNVIMDQAIIKSLNVTHERFLLGIPTRAKVAVALESIPFGSLPGTNPTSGGLASRRTRTVVEGDTLASLAFQEYDDPNYWRALAEANGIDDPMRVGAGTVLVIPEQRDAQTLLGESS